MTKSVRYYIQPLDDDQAVVRSVPVARPLPAAARPSDAPRPVAAPDEPTPPRSRQRRARVARLVRAAIRRDH